MTPKGNGSQFYIHRAISNKRKHLSRDVSLRCVYLGAAEITGESKVKREKER